MSVLNEIVRQMSDLSAELDQDLKQPNIQDKNGQFLAEDGKMPPPPQLVDQSSSSPSPTASNKTRNLGRVLPQSSGEDHENNRGVQVVTRISNILRMMLRVERRPHDLTLRNQTAHLNIMNIWIGICCILIYTSFGYSVFWTWNSYQEKDEMVLLLGLGQTGSGQELNDFYLVNIDLDGQYCNILDDFPETGYDSSGGFAHGKIITCGGILSLSHSKQCYYYSDNKWELFGNLNDEKSGHDSAILPNGNLWITGGYNGRYLSSTDTIDKDFNITRGPPLPSAMNGHCIVNWNDTHMLLTGGWDHSSRNETHFFNAETEEWTDGPPMNYGRYDHGCVSFEGNRKDESGQRIAMVTGAYNPESLSKTAELFDGESWTIVDLPISVGNAKAVVYKGRVIVTGEDYLGNPLPTAWVFDIATREWSKGFTMSPSIKQHNSFLVPKSLCS